MSHRFLLRLVTNLAIYLLTFACFGIVLWVIDEILRWDILPDAISLIVQALLVAGGIIAFVLVVMNVLLSLALMAEANASRANLPDYAVSARLKRRVRRSIVVSLLAIALLLSGLQITNHLRSRAAVQTARTEFNQQQAGINTALPEVLALFTPELLDGLENNTLVEKGQLGNLSKLLRSIPTAFPHQPAAKILISADQSPYKYAQIGAGNIRTNNSGKIVLTPDLYPTFPTEVERGAVEQLFNGNLSELSAPLAGQFINNTVPSTWGVLKRNGNIIAIVHLQSDNFENSYFRGAPPLRSSQFHHSGPTELISN